MMAKGLVKHVPNGLIIFISTESFLEQSNSWKIKHSACDVYGINGKWIIIIKMLEFVKKSLTLSKRILISLNWCKIKD
jgi:hypothetical protein